MIAELEGSLEVIVRRCAPDRHDNGVDVNRQVHDDPSVGLPGQLVEDVVGHHDERAHRRNTGKEIESSRRDPAGLVALLERE